MSNQLNIYNEPPKLNIPELKDLENRVNQYEDVPTGSFNIAVEVNDNSNNGYKYVKTPKTRQVLRNKNNIKAEAITLQKNLERKRKNDKKKYLNRKLKSRTRTHKFLAHLPYKSKKTKQIDKERKKRNERKKEVRNTILGKIVCKTLDGEEIKLFETIPSQTKINLKDILKEIYHREMIISGMQIINTNNKNVEDLGGQEQLLIDYPDIVGEQLLNLKSEHPAETNLLFRLRDEENIKLNLILVFPPIPVENNSKKRNSPPKTARSSTSSTRRSASSARKSTSSARRSTGSARNKNKTQPALNLNNPFKHVTNV